jgi:hypothetical protein
VATSLDPTGVFVIRVWCEPSHPEPLRARIGAANDIGSARATHVVGADAVIDLLRSWLFELEDATAARCARDAAATLARHE